jgi:Ca2+:H+ antiporter
MPAVFDLATSGSLLPDVPAVYPLALPVALVLLGTYLASLVFSLRTHQTLFKGVAMEPRSQWLSPRESVGLLLVLTVVTAVEAELLVSTITAAAAALGMSEFFAGVIVVGVIGNAAEYYSALSMAAKNRMELAMTIAAGSATQVALFVAPVLVLTSLLIGHPMSPVFNVFEIMGITLAVLAFSVVALDGESNWFEGVELIAVYLVLAIVFYFVPSL